MVLYHDLSDMQTRERDYNLPQTTFSDMFPTEQVKLASIHKCAYSNHSIA